MRPWYFRTYYLPSMRRSRFILFADPLSRFLWEPHLSILHQEFVWGYWAVYKT